MPCRVNGIVWAPCLGALVLPRVPSGSAPSVLRQNQRRLQLHQLASLPQRQRQRRLQMISASQEVRQLKAEVVELKAAIERLTAEVVEPKDEDTKQTKKARPGHTIAVAFTEDEATEMRDNAERTRALAESLLNLSSDMCGPCHPWSVEQIADQMQHDGNQIVTLSSRLLQLCNHKGLLELLSSRGV